MTEDYSQLIGMSLKVTLQNQQIFEGDFYYYNPQQQQLILKNEDELQNKSFNLINSKYIQEVKIIQYQQQKQPIQMQKFDIENILKFEQNQIEKEQCNKLKLNSNVSSKVQFLFNELSKIYQATWENQTIYLQQLENNSTISERELCRKQSKVCIKTIANVDQHKQKTNKMINYIQYQIKMIFNYGDTVVIYEDRNKQSLVTLIEDGKFQNQFGSFQHSQIVNQKSGSKIYSKNQRFIYVLEPTSVLISAAVPHKTQILYSMDIAQIIQRLNLIPGSKVIETGTGSGSLSCSILNSISKDGHLYTYEFNLDRYNNGKQLFNRLNYNNVTVVHRDTCGEGFLPQNEDFQLPEIDAVFLDVPKPWEAVIHATKVLKKSGRICCFSPCIEQVQKNCETMEKYGFAEIVTIESLVREYQTITKQDKFDFSIQEENQEEVNDEQNEKDEQDEKKDDNNNKRKRQNGPPQPQQQTQKKVFISSGAQSQKGHTGYLTFGIFK